LVDQLPTLLGVSIGAVATYAATSLSERSRWQRERSARWDVARMHAYSEYGEAVKKVFHLASRLAAARDLPHNSEPLEPNQEAMELLSNAEGERAGAWEPVLLMGDPQTVAAARSWHQAIWRVVWFAQGRLIGVDQWEVALSESERARDKFYEAARRDLGVQGAAMPTPPWPPQWMRDALTPDSSEGTHVEPAD